MKLENLLFLGIILLVLGCTGTYRLPFQRPLCDEPYMQVGDACCLDKNNNGICDIDDPVEDTTAESATPEPGPEETVEASEPEEETATLTPFECEATIENELLRHDFDVYSYELKRLNPTTFTDEYRIHKPMEIRLTLKRADYKNAMSKIKAELKDSQSYQTNSNSVARASNMVAGTSSDYVYLIWNITPEDIGSYYAEVKVDYESNGMPRTLCPKITIRTFETGETLELEILNYSISEYIIGVGGAKEPKSYSSDVLNLETYIDPDAIYAVTPNKFSTVGYRGTHNDGEFIGTYSRNVYVQSTAAKMCEVGNLKRYGKSGENTYYIEFYRNYYDKECVKAPLCDYPSRVALEIEYGQYSIIAYKDLTVTGCR